MPRITLNCRNINVLAKQPFAQMAAAMQNELAIGPTLELCNKALRTSNFSTIPGASLQVLALTELELPFRNDWCTAPSSVPRAAKLLSSCGRITEPPSLYFDARTKSLSK